MPKVIISLTVLIFLSLFPKTTLADISVTSIPSANDIFQNTPKITVEVANDKNNFNPDVGYTFSAWSTAEANKGCLPIGQYSKNSNTNQPQQLSVDSNKIAASWNLNGPCNQAIGEWKFQLWSGQGTKDRNNNSLIADYTFTIQQVGGAIPTLTPLQQTVQLGTKPTVLVSNARVDNSYTFWWERLGQRDSAAMKKVGANDLKNGILFVELNLTDDDFKAGVTRKLCMEIGDYTGATGVLGVTCHYSTTFNFSNNPPPATGIQCSILPSQTPTVNDDINLKITNAVPGTLYTGYLNMNGEPGAAISGTVDATKTLIIPLGQKLSPGLYSPHVIDTSSGQVLNSCNISFNVGDTDTSNRLKDICKKNPEKCTLGGGKEAPGCTTDKNNPGIATAIGCIHTNPAELVKDFITFTVGIGGGLSFLMMLLGAFQMLTSAGNPETLNAGRSRITSAVIGLLMVIFAVLLLQIIGVDILRIPGFE